MKKAFVLALVACVGGAYADTTLNDFETGVAAGNWLPAFSGTTDGVDEATDTAAHSTEQAAAGAQSLKWTWSWRALVSPETQHLARIQPAAGLSNNSAVNHTAEPYIGAALYGASQGDTFEIYMGEGAAGGGASPYEVFASEFIVNWNGWRICERNILTDAVVGWVNGDSTLSPTCSLSGFFFYKAAAVPVGTAVTYYLDEVKFTTNPRFASVANWSVY